MRCGTCNVEMVKTHGNMKSTMSWDPIWRCPRCKKARRRAVAKGGDQGQTVLPVLPNQRVLEQRLRDIFGV